MSTYLWKYYLEDDINAFRRLLANASYNASASTKSHGSGAGTNTGATLASPGAGFSTSPKLIGKTRKGSGTGSVASSVGTKGQRLSNNVNLSRADVNYKDSFGVTLLHHISSSPAPTASLFALAFLDISFLDLYAQDLESGWTALHRALYFGNITIARALINRDSQDSVRHGGTVGAHAAGGLIKIKDREGNSPFDVFGASITNRILHYDGGLPLLSSSGDEDEDEVVRRDSGDGDGEGLGSRSLDPRTFINGDELFTFGSNKNLNLGFGDEDDRQYPERVTLQRPDHLLRRLCTEHCSKSRSDGKTSPVPHGAEAFSPARAPALARYQPIILQDVQLSKLHTAVLTADPEANLYVCGFGPGGRLGTGDELTKFNFTCIFGGSLMGKKVLQVGLGQNHTIAITNEGEVSTWGNNTFGQLGYSLPKTAVKNEEPIQLCPRQIFGPLKREVVIGAAASRVHSVIHTATSLYTFGKNDGQLGLVDSDARSLAIQAVPRKVAASLFSSPIRMVSAIDRATSCLLENHDVWVFANYGYARISFPLDGFSNYFLKKSYTATRYEQTPNHIMKITSGGDTICALAKAGNVFTVTVSEQADSSGASTSTTNPTKIRGALSPAQCVWSLRKGHMAVRDVDVGQDGSIIICTESGSVWRRIRRAKIKDAHATASNEYKAKDYKFSRVPSLTRIAAVRSNQFGAYAAVRRDCDVVKTQVNVSNKTIWRDVFPLLPFYSLCTADEDSDTENPMPRFWTPRQGSHDVASFRHFVLNTADIEAAMARVFGNLEMSDQSTYDLRVGTTTSDVYIPCHEFILAGRSNVMRQALSSFRQKYFSSIVDVLTVEYDKDGKTLVLFQGVDPITILNLVLYIYTDLLVDVWHHTRRAPQLAFRYRQIRSELMKIASQIDLRSLEQAARIMNQPAKTLHQDLEQSILEPSYFESGDVEVGLDKSTLIVHSALMCRRCPFFEGLFQGRAGGKWLSSRRQSVEESQETIKVDLEHIDPRIFRLVLRHLYADTGEELFDNIVTADLDAFLDIVMDVMSVANELMIDRLMEICQKVLGRFVNTRNVCQLLNAVAPCSVTRFKDAALEYICLNLEGMLENHLLTELDDDLMLELDEVVRQNQLACLPFAKSGRADAELHEHYPELAEIIERHKRSKIDSMTLSSRLHEDENWFASSTKARASTEEIHKSPLVQKLQPKASRDMSALKSPSLTTKTSVSEMMFTMDEEDEQKPNLLEADVYGRSSAEKEDEVAPGSQPRTPSSSVPGKDVWFNAKGKALSPNSTLYSISPMNLEIPSPLPRDLKSSRAVPTELYRDAQSDGSSPWGSAALAASKLNMKEIMAQASLSRNSSISSGLASRDKVANTTLTSSGGKLSQRERKQQQQQKDLQNVIAPNATVPNAEEHQEKRASPWQTTSMGARVSLKNVLSSDDGQGDPQAASNSPAPSSAPLTLRQTVPGNMTTTQASSGKVRPSSTAQQRSVSSPIASKQSPLPASPTTPSRQVPPARRSQSQQLSPSPSSSSIVVQSIRHHAPPVEPSLQLSMADILALQQSEKDVIKEAVAKRSLQEIQEEQAFQEWWDEESRKVMEDEQKKVMESSAARGRGDKPGRGGSGRGGKARGKGRGAGKGKEKAQGQRGESSSGAGGRGGGRAAAEAGQLSGKDSAR